MLAPQRSHGNGGEGDQERREEEEERVNAILNLVGHTLSVIYLHVIPRVITLGIPHEVAHS